MLALLEYVIGTIVRGQGKYSYCKFGSRNKLPLNLYTECLTGDPSLKISLYANGWVVRISGDHNLCDICIQSTNFL